MECRFYPKAQKQAVEQASKLNSNLNFILQWMWPHCGVNHRESISKTGDLEEMSLLGKEGRGATRGAASTFTPRCLVVQMHSLWLQRFFGGRVLRHCGIPGVWWTIVSYQLITLHNYAIKWLWEMPEICFAFPWIYNLKLSKYMLIDPLMQYIFNFYLRNLKF